MQNTGSRYACKLWNFYFRDLICRMWSWPSFESVVHYEGWNANSSKYVSLLETNSQTPENRSSYAPKGGNDLTFQPFTFQVYSLALGLKQGGYIFSSLGEEALGFVDGSPEKNPPNEQRLNWRIQIPGCCAAALWKGSNKNTTSALTDIRSRGQE